MTTPGCDAPCGTHAAARLARSTRASLAAFAALTGMALTACGGGPQTLPLNTVVSKVDAICARYTFQIETIPSPSFTPASVSAAELPTAARYLNRAVPLLESEQSSIEAVGRPETSRSLYSGVLTALGAQVRDEQAALKAALGKNLSAFGQAVISDQRDSTRLAGVAQQIGLTRCV